MLFYIFFYKGLTSTLDLHIIRRLNGLIYDFERYGEKN